MSEKIWELVDYDCQDGKCLMLWNMDEDNKLGALSLDHRDIGEAIVDEFNKLENFNRDIKEYIEKVEDCNEGLRYIRDKLESEKYDLKEELQYYKMKSGQLETDLFDVERELEKLKKDYYLLHMSSMFSTVKSFNGKVDERYKYDELNGRIYDTANHYGQYSRIIDMEEATLLLNEYNALLEKER